MLSLVGILQKLLNRYSFYVYLKVMEQKKIVKKFFEFELKNKLFKKKIYKKKYLNIVRHNVFIDIQNQILGDKKSYIYNKSHLPRII